MNAGFDARLAKTCDGAAAIGILRRYTSVPPAVPATPAVRVMQAEFLARTRAGVEPARRALACLERSPLLDFADFLSGTGPALAFDPLARMGKRLRDSACQNDWPGACRHLEGIAATAQNAAIPADRAI
jgi:hypothetical protein